MKPGWLGAAEIIAKGGTATAAAAACEVDPRTVRRWLADEAEFVAAVDEMRKAMLEETALMLAAECTGAVAKLGEIVRTGTTPYALTAAGKILDQASRYRNDQTTETRIRALEVQAGLRRG